MERVDYMLTNIGPIKVSVISGHSPSFPNSEHHRRAIYLFRIYQIVNLLLVPGNFKSISPMQLYIL
jgi:hypothetical protein